MAGDEAARYNLETWRQSLETWNELQSIGQSRHLPGTILPSSTCSFLLTKVLLVENQPTQLWQLTIIPVPR